MFAAIDIIAAPFVLAATETAEDEGLNPLVRVVPGLMIWTLLAFVVAMLVLRKYAWPQITRILDARQTQIEDSIDAAERTRQEADQLLAEYRERLAEARAQADEIVAKAERAGEVAEREAIDAAKVKREDLLEQTRRDIQAETQAAIQEIRREVADLTVAATEKVTRKTLSAEDQKRLVEEALSELDFSALSGDRRN
ncbi:F0F1 ATP synthase subunit B [Conexibacter stalactiti]|uniref:ATP synthase subunit b n=1 Tax=Conexibacter stalactiti TaxID=1940611 RepID=A0ABU4HTJ5_9ACTN|nr:F0F1 ATP synthase subunit B [Conexibacter stalactiti]MDW5596631.1 F0F1 ATP synthase subunit B [Conexibacter stalactiti]MEC5037273.1 F0F1 ATP synthase subunit B [Conexibacter stalactiti]